MKSSESCMFVWSYKILENLNSGEQNKWLSPGQGAPDEHINLCYLSVFVFLSADPCVLFYVIEAGRD